MSDPLKDFLGNPCDWIESDDESESGTLSRFDGNQIRIDIVAGVLRDWTCIAAGLPGPWTESSEYPLTNVLGGRQPRRSRSSITVVSERNTAGSPASTDPEDLFCISGSSHTDPVRTGSLSRSRRRPGTVEITSRRTSVSLPVPDLVDDVSSRKRRRVLQNRIATSCPDVLVDHVDLRDDINALPLSLRNLEAHASADFWVNSMHQRAKLKSQAARIKDPTIYQRLHQIPHPSSIPLTSQAGCISALFVSELVPSSFTSIQRFQVLDVLHYEAPYIPTCIVGTTGQIPQLYFGSLHCNKHLLPEHIDNNTCEMSQTLGSPLTARSNATLPVEVLTQIAHHLNRLEMQALLLTSKDFNAKLGPLYFQHVVLPFKSNIFSGMNNTSSIDKASSSGTLPVASSSSTIASHSGEELKNLHSEINMFKTWGSWIKKIGFSLEADQDELANAPKKQVMNSYTSFYEHNIPWPAREYLLNPTIQKLEMTAEQMNLMEQAFSSLNNVNELALAVDSGLGYLEGFDRSDRARIVADKAEFFGRRFALSKADEIRSWLEVGSSALARFSLHDRQIYDSYVKVLRGIPHHADTLISLVTYYMNKNPRGTLSHLATMDIFGHVKTIMLRAGVITIDEHPQQWSTFEKLLSAKGLTETDVMTGSLWNLRPPRPIPSMLHNAAYDSTSYKEYHTTAASALVFPENHRLGPLSVSPNARTSYHADSQPNLEIWDKFSMTAVRDLNRALLTRLFCGTAGSPPPVIFDGISIDDWEGSTISHETFEMKPLKPRLLTLAQKQWLVETGWMQQTFMTSYINSIIKNKARFATVRSFTLAKLSSRYLPRLQDRQFWNALCQLENLTILVSPDWREFTPGHEGEFSSKTLAPSRACSMLMKLLRDLSTIASIKSLKTGFIGGGEHAVGLHARNQHLLPAPITDEERSKRHIVMPFIENLTFVNCWFVHSMLMAFLRDMIRKKLRTVHFDSVSLLVAGGKTTYFPAIWPKNFPRELFPDPSTGTIPPFYLGYNVPQPSYHDIVRQSQITPYNVPPRPPTQDGYRVPISWKSQRLHADTWAKIIDAYTPGQTLKEKKAALAGEPANPRSHVEGKRLVSLKFTSCGYAKLGYQQLGHVLDEPQGPPRNSFLDRRKGKMEVYMMKSADPFLGEIVPKLIHPELAILTGGFGMTVGPGGDPGRLDNREDGKWDRGTGRFSGEVVRA